MKNKIKKILSTTIVITVLVQNCLSVHAGSLNSNASYVGLSVTGSLPSGETPDPQPIELVRDASNKDMYKRTGYRMYLVDNKMNLMSIVTDIIPGNGIDKNLTKIYSSTFR